MKHSTDPRYDVRCSECGQAMTFLDWHDHVHPDPAPELLEALRASNPSIPSIGPTSEGKGELAGGDVQAMPRRPKTRRRANRHDQRTPLPGDPDFVRPSLTPDILREMLAERPSSTVSRHDYEPGTETGPMHTDPLCRTCGAPANDRSHR